MMLKKIRKILEKIAEDEKTPTLEELLFYFDRAVLLTKEEYPSLEGEKLERRVLNLLKGYLNKQIYGKGNPFTFLCFGVLFPPKDKNKVLRDKILKDWEDPGKRAGMIRQGKVMFMTIGEDRVPIKEFDWKDTHMENDELIIDRGEPCDLGAGDLPIPRDNRKKIKYEGQEEGYDNFQYSKPLDPNWQMTVIGVGFFDGVKKVKDAGEIIEVEKTLKDAIKTRVQVYGPLANPHSEHFLGKESIWFMPLKFNASESGRSNMLVQQVVGKGAFTLGLNDVNIEKVVNYLNKKAFKMFRVLNEKVDKMRAKAKETEDDNLLKKAKEIYKTAKLFEPYTEGNKKYIPFIDLIDKDDYHNQYAVQYKEDDEGELIISRNKDGWDKTSFDAFALCKCMYTGFFSKQGKTPKMMLTDWSIPDTMFTGFVPILNTEIENGEVYVCLTTSRSDKVYDESTNKYVRDPENATAFFKVKGIKLVRGLKGTAKKYEESLKGDM